MAQRAADDLALIRQLMEEGRRAVVDRGKHFMIWGGVSAVGLAGTYLSVVGWLGVGPQWVWVPLVVVGWVLSAVVGRRDARRLRVQTAGARLLARSWLGTGVVLTLVAASGLFGGVVSHLALPGLVSVVMGGAVLATSELTGEGWLVWAAAGWWAGGGLMLFVPGLYTLGLMAAMVIALMVVPGVVLYDRTRARDTSAEGAGT